MEHTIPHNSTQYSILIHVNIFQEMYKLIDCHFVVSINDRINLVRIRKWMKNQVFHTEKKKCTLIHDTDEQT